MLLEKCFILLFLFHVIVGQTRIDPLVSTDVGLIKGLKADDGDYSMFLGIPFAKVDVDNPFGKAEPYPVFENTFEANSDGAACPQILEFTEVLGGSLDCLNLNIYVPSSATSVNRLPVLVWIFGGAFRTGSGDRYVYGPSYLVKHDIILVTVNYRVGPYGFMCLDTPEIPGNQGLKDQLLALRWIKKHIVAFGGDSNRITISGESAGSIAVDMHLIFNNEDLYDKAILQSGTALSPAIREPIWDAPIILAEYLGTFTNSTDTALDFLVKADPHLLVSAVHNLGLEDHFRPCVEKEFEGVESFITDNWITADMPKVKNMPILIGFNSDERYFLQMFEEEGYYEKLNTVQNNLVLGFDVSAEEFTGMEDKVRHFYFGDEPISAKVKQGVFDFESDFKNVHPTYRSISKYLENNAGNIYLYVFSYVGERNLIKYFYNLTNATGAAHFDEISYLFDVSFMKDVPITPEDQIIIDQITTMWTNFVKFGNPTPQVSDLLQVKWPPITSQSVRPYLNIDSPLKAGARPFNQRVTFWDLFYKINERLQIAYPSAKVEL